MTSGSRIDRRWDLIAIGVVANMCLGTVYSWSVFRAPLEVAFAFSPDQTGLPYAVFLALFAFSMPVGGKLQSVIGARLTIAAGSVAVGAGWILAGLVETIPALAATYGLLGGLGVGLAYGVPLAVVGSWFPGRRGLALGITLTGFGLSPFVTAPIAELLIESLGVSAAFRSLGFAFLVVLLSLSFLFKPRYPVGGVGVQTPTMGATHAGASVGASGPNLDPKAMLRSAPFYVLWVCFAFGTFSGLTAIGMTASFGVEIVGLTNRTAATTVAIFGVFNGLGRPLFGWLTDAWGTKNTATLAFAIVIAGALLVSQVGILGSFSFFVGFALLWMLLGGWLAIAPAATTKIFGPLHYAENYGIMYTGYGVGALGGGAVSSLLIRMTATQTATFWAIVVVAAAGIVLARMLLPGRVTVPQIAE